MSSSNRKSGKKDSKQLSVTTRCVAIVFKRAVSPEETEDVGSMFDEKLHVELHEEYHDKDKRGPNEICKDAFNAKAVLEEFKFRNKTCYWNPALVDSIKSLEYVGFIEPLTILVKGGDIHLENVRTAWGRRVLKDPIHFRIQRIGDVSGIEMQVVPQTQFIPLPEALCLVIMDLNNKQIVATLETVCEKLKDCYQGLHLPGNQLVYETLGTLIRERKVFHTGDNIGNIVIKGDIAQGCGYFVVTPDTFRFHGDEMQSTMFSPWTHLHPMYIPAVFGQPYKQPTRSISCQVDVKDNLIGPTESCDKQETGQPNKDSNTMKENPSMRTQRSMSFSVRRSREKSKKDEVPAEGSLKRSSSVKGRNEAKQPINDTSSEPVVKVEKLKKEKVSLFSKLFGRNKKKPPAPEPKKPVVEYASFSAQFPPPEWMWYQQQLDKQVRTETWVQQQIVKSGTWHHLHSLPSDFGAQASAHFGTSSAPDRNTQPVNHNENVNPNFISNAGRRSHKKSHRSKGRTPLVIVNSPSEGGTPLDLGEYHTYRNSMGHPGIRLSSLPTRLPQTSEVVHSNYVSHPIVSSTPRSAPVPDNCKPLDLDFHHTNHGKGEKVKSHGSKKTHKSRKSKSQSNRHSSYYPSSRHVSGLSASHNSQLPPDVDDISMEYHGTMPAKYSSLGLSRSSGVNCNDMENNEGHHKGHKYYRSRSYRQSYNEYDSRVRGNCDGGGVELLYQNTNVDQVPMSEHFNREHDSVNAHIYANVHISNPEEIKPKLPERIHKKSHKDRSKDHHSEETSLKQTVPEHYRLGVQLVEHDRHSEHSSEQGTIRSSSSQEQSSQDSAIDGTESSEHSLGTVINTQSIVNKHLDKLMAQTHDLSLGDSGFSSPRVSETCSDGRKGDCNLNFKKEQTGFTCNNLKMAKNAVNSSLGKLDDFSDDSGGRITSDTLYENVKLNQREVLNNMKYLHKEINVSSQNLNMPPPPSGQESGDRKGDYDPKQPIVKKFNFEGDFHVVGVV